MIRLSSFIGSPRSTAADPLVVGASVDRCEAGRAFPCDSPTHTLRQLGIGHSRKDEAVGIDCDQVPLDIHDAPGTEGFPIEDTSISATGSRVDEASVYAADDFLAAQTAELQELTQFVKTCSVHELHANYVLSRSGNHPGAVMCPLCPLTPWTTRWRMRLIKHLNEEITDLKVSNTTLTSELVKANPNSIPSHKLTESDQNANQADDRFSQIEKELMEALAEIAKKD